MPEPTEIQTQEPEPTPPQNVEDPNKVEEIFKEAAKSLEYEEDPQTSLQPEPETPPETEPEKPKKPARKKIKAKEPEPEPEPEKEPETEPKLSKREQFKQMADAEKAYREKEGKLKEREAEIHKLELAFREFQADPIAYLEKQNPRAYEEWTERNLAVGKSPESTETASLKAEIEKLREEITGKHEEVLSKATHAQHMQYLNEAQSILHGDEFADVWKAAEYLEEVNATPIDPKIAIASVYDEYHTRYGKELTQRECCEILLEDAQALLERLSKSDKLRSIFGPETPAEKPKRRTPPTGKTLTNDQETLSSPEKPVDLGHIKSKEELLQEAVKLIKYKEEEE